MPSKSALKLSETFGKLLFNAGHHTSNNSKVHGLVWSDSHDIRDFLYKIITMSEKEYSSHIFHKTKTNVMTVEKNRIDIVSKFGDVDGVIYGIWNEDGPQLIQEWLSEKPRTSSVEITKIFMKFMKKYNMMVSDVSNMDNAKNMLSRHVRLEASRNTRVHPAPASGGRRVTYIKRRSGTRRRTTRRRRLSA